MGLRLRITEVDALNTAIAGLDELRLATTALDELRLAVQEIIIVSVAVAFIVGEVGDVSTTVVEVTYTATVSSPLNDYTLGVTIKVNAGSVTVSSAARQTDTSKVRYTFASAVDINDTVTFEYASGPGDLQDSGGGDLGDIAAMSVTNNVGEHFYFDTADDSAHIWTAGF